MTNGSPNALLDRTLKIAIHETGHMFSMKHCTKYECLMSGTNNLAETDRRPLDVCPECMAKIAWAFRYDPAERYRRLAEFWRSQKREVEAHLADQKRAAVLAVRE
jgi:archaemetzincin